MTSSLRNPLTWAVIGALIVLACAPSFAWLYDGGPEQRLSVGVKDGSSLAWAAQPFDVSSDSYVTGVGAAISKAFGPAGSGFDVYLTDNPSDPIESALAHWTLVPLNASLVYYYADAPSPVFVSANKPYAIVLMPNTNNFYGSISLSASAGYYGMGSGDNGASWFYLSRPLCVRVDGYAAPEPCSLAVLGLGMGLVTIRRRLGNR